MTVKHKFLVVALTVIALCVIAVLLFGYNASLQWIFGIYARNSCVGEGGSYGVGPYGGDLHCCEGLSGTAKARKIGNELEYEAGGGYCVRPGCSVLQLGSSVTSTVLRCPGEADTPFRK